MHRHTESRRQRSARRSLLIATTLAVAPASSAVAGDARPDRWAWGENVGWINFEGRPNSAGRVRFLPSGLAGFAWGENIGWINVGQCGEYRPADQQGPVNPPFETDPTRFGVRIEGQPGDPIRPLSGYAWGENIGWLNFNTWDLNTLDASGERAGARIEGGRLRGFVWGENIGWVNLDDDVHFVSVALACSAADVANPQGVLDLSDITAFVDAALVSGRLADIDCNTIFDLSDVNAFVSAFLAGCP